MYQINLLTRNRICLLTPIPIPTPQPGEFFQKTLRIFMQSNHISVVKNEGCLLDVFIMSLFYPYLSIYTTYQSEQILLLRLDLHSNL